MTTRYLVLAVRRPAFDASVVAPHLAFLEQLRDNGQLEMTGGFSDGSGGAYILVNIDSLAQAEAIVAQDPLALQSASDLTVHEWNTRDSSGHDSSGRDSSERDSNSCGSSGRADSHDPGTRDGGVR